MKNALLSNLGVKMAGVAMLLLPFFVSPFAASQEAQLQGAKLMAVFLLGNFAFSLLLAREIHWVFGLIHGVISLLVWATGFGPMQLYPFAYWSAAVIFSLWFLRLPRCSRGALWKSLMVGAMLCCLHAFVQALGWETAIRDWVVARLPATEPFFLHYAPGKDQSLPIGYFGQHTKLGAFLAPMAAFALAWGWIPAAALLALGAIITKSSFTLAALFVGFLVCLRWSHKNGARMAMGALILTALAGVVLAWRLPNSDVFLAHGRFEVWGEALRAWWNGPFWIGYGLGSFSLEAPPTQVVQDGIVYQVRESFFSANFQGWYTRQFGNFAQAHNDYLQVLFEMGAIGGLLMLVALGVLIRAMYLRWWIWPWRGPRPDKEVRAAQAMLIALLVNALGNFPFQLAPHFLLGVLSFAILLKDAKENDTI